MADDLATLHQFGVFQDEEEVRLEVAARVVASSSRAAIEDEEKVQQAWRALEQAEHRVSELEGELDDAARTAAEEASPLLTPTTTTASASAQSSSARRVSDIRFQLNAAKRELSRADAAVRKVQVEVERRQAARLAEAKRKEKESLAAEQQQQQQQPQQQTGSAAATTTTTVARRVPAPAAAATSANGSPRSAQDGTPTPNGTATPAGTRTTTTRVLYRAPQHLRGVTRSDYSGGDVLPSLSRVQVTRADIRSKQRRYQDDTDMEHFVDRIAKRQRLESVAYQQRRRAAETMTTPLSTTIGAAAALKREEGAVQVKEEPGTTSRTRRSTATKKEADEGREEAKTMQQQVKVEDSVSGSDDDVDVIDVDALMEDDDDAAVAAAVDRAATQLQRAGNSQDGRSHSTTPLASQSSQADAAAPADLTVEMEEVTLMPGVRMDAAIHSRLLDYQQEGLLWLLSLHSRRAGGILGDEMGLGKTIQVAALINALHHSSLLRGPVLIVAPMTVLRQWLAELHRWAPYVRSCVMHESGNSGSAREPFLRSVQGTPAVVITTFSAMREHCGMLQRTGFQYVILDEGHKISNPEAGVTLAAKSFTTPHRLILSGSPIQNSLKELWCLFDFVRPGLLGTMNRFIDEFETPIAQSRNVRATPLALATAVECAKTLQAHIAPFLLRRLKRQVNTQLPPKYERVLRVPLTDQQLEQYLQVLTSPVVQRLFAQTVMYGSSYGGLDRDGRDSTGSLHVAGARLNMATRRNNSGVRLESFRLMNQLRQICNHADIYAVQRGADEEDRMTLHRSGSLASQLQRSPQRSGKYQHRSFRSNNPVNLLGSGKLNALLMMLKEWKSFGHRVLVFSQTRMMLDIIENMCEQQSYTYIRMDGMTSGHHRQELMDRFNEDPNIFVALLTTRVGGIGVNLIGADRVVIFDPDWNPITDVQARERAWRIGQRREVCVYRLITSGSVEESILRRQLAKMYVTDKVLNDPELQRFFHVQDSFMESFLLGSEYEARVPLDKRYLLTAHQLNKSAASASARRGPQVDESLGDYGGAADDAERSSEEVSDAEEEDAVANGAVATKAEKDVQPTRAERDFGLLVPVKDEADDANTTGVTTSSREGEAAVSAKPVKGRGETQLLQDLVDQQDVVVAGSDRVAQRLARRKAEEMIQRVSSQQSVLEVMREQQRRFSLRSALEAKKAEEAAEREEKRQYHKEELAAEAATKRRRL